MKKLLFLLFFPVFAYSQGIATTKEMEDNTIIIAPQTAYVKGTNTINGAVKLKRIRIDSLVALSTKGVSALITNKAELSYVNSQLATKTTPEQVASITATKMDSTRVKSLLTLKANLADLNNKVDNTTFNNALSTKANSSDLALKENTADVNAKLGFKVTNSALSDTVTSINSRIATKASIISMNALNNTVSANTANIATNSMDLSTKLSFIVSSTFSAIPAQSGANYKMILVLTDETNNNYPTFYLYDGVGLQVITTQKTY